MALCVCATQARGYLTRVNAELMNENSMMKNSQLNKTRLLKMANQTGAYQQGAVLLESLIAIVIFSFGILAISGLQGAMMKNTADATYRAEASYLVQQVVGNMLVNPLALARGSSSASSLPGGIISVTPVAGGSGGRVNITVTWRVPGEVDTSGNQIVHNYKAVSSIFTR